SLEFARDRIELKKISVVKNYARDICPIFIDKEKVEIALLNIIVNAVEAMNDYGTLSISTQAKNNRCIVKISDTGRGMSKEEINSLFEPFFTTKEKGTGLGLTNSQNIILAHHGSITVESEIDRGTTFNIGFNLA
ncbi:MAG TPA: ATP-binding protein, partial [Chitinophagaceae bacterium]|nr:ATP-binding protein [Chitinophagaceae bacterium]